MPALTGDHELDHVAALRACEAVEEKLDEGRGDDARSGEDVRLGFAAYCQLDVADGTDAAHERHRGLGGLAERNPRGRSALLASKALEGAHDLTDFAARPLHELETRVELRAGRCVGERELGAADEREQRIRDLVQRTSCQPSERPERAIVLAWVGRSGHGSMIPETEGFERTHCRMGAQECTGLGRPTKRG